MGVAESTENADIGAGGNSSIIRRNEDTRRNGPVERADVASDARVAALLQAQSWQDDTVADERVASLLQAEMWKECTRRVTHDAGAIAEHLSYPIARPPTALLPLEDAVTHAANELAWKLSDYGLRPRDIIGDGACQFRAVADQMYGDQEPHALVRARSVAEMRLHYHLYEGFTDGETFPEYLDRMSILSAWGDNLSLQAIANAFNIEVCIVSSYLSRSFICISPSNGSRPTGKIWLGFYAEYHYTSLEPIG